MKTNTRILCLLLGLLFLLSAAACGEPQTSEVTTVPDQPIENTQTPAPAACSLSRKHRQSARPAPRHSSNAAMLAAAYPGYASQSIARPFSTP